MNTKIEMYITVNPCNVIFTDDITNPSIWAESKLRDAASPMQVHEDAMFDGFVGNEQFFTNMYLDLVTLETTNPTGCSTVDIEVPDVGLITMTVLEGKLYDFTIMEPGIELVIKPQCLN